MKMNYNVQNQIEAVVNSPHRINVLSCDDIQSTKMRPELPFLGTRTTGEVHALKIYSIMVFDRLVPTWVSKVRCSYGESL